MDLVQLKYLATVVKHESYSLAAEALGMTQPPLSIAINKLSRKLGVELFEKQGRGVKPTPAARELAEMAASLLSDAEHIKEYMKKWNTGAAGNLSLASVPSFNWAHLSPLLSEFLSIYPEVDPLLSDPPPENVLEVVDSGAQELGVICTPDYVRFQEIHRGKFFMEEIIKIPQIVAVPPAWDMPPTVHMEQLVDKLWLMPDRPLDFPDNVRYLDALWLKLGLERPSIRHSGTLQTVLPLVASGMGVSIMPQSVADITNGAVALRQLAEPLPLVSAVILWKGSRRLTATADNFLQMARSFWPAESHKEASSNQP